MNIFIVAQMNKKSPTGVTTYYLQLQKKYEIIGHNVEIINPEDRSSFSSFTLKLFRTINRLIPSKVYKIYGSEMDGFFSLLSALKQSKKKKKMIVPDIIHAQDPSAAAAATIAFKKKVPVLLTCHFNDSPVEEKKIAYTLSNKQVKKIEKFYSWIFSKCNYYIFVSAYCFHKSAYLMPTILASKIIHNGVEFNPILKEKNKNELFEIVNVGTIETRKNQSFLIDIAYQLSKKSFPFLLKFYGTGPLHQSYQQKAAKLQIETSVKFEGFRKDVKEKIKTADLYIHSALNENCSIAVLEAFSQSIPVFALATGGTPELFSEDLDSGLLDKNISAQQAAEIIIEKNKSGYLLEMQKKQYNYASQRFSLDKMSTSTFEFYQKCIEDFQLQKSPATR